ncbi:MAG: hypothetical protein ACLU48_09225 [Clostridiaceae bacterium]
MQSVVSCGQTELFWTGNLLISPVKKTGCPMYSEGSGDSRRNTVPGRSEAEWAYAKLASEYHGTGQQDWPFDRRICLARIYADAGSVFEYLEMKGKISGKKRQKLHLWKKREIQTMCEHKAHRYGIRVSRVCAWELTSRLAYDGKRTGQPRSKEPQACVFSNLENSITVIVVSIPTISERDTGFGKS